MEGFVLHILKLNLIAAGIILLVKVMAMLLKGRFTALWKYLVWLMLSLSLLIPVRLPADLSVIQLEINTAAQHPLSDSNYTEGAPAGSTHNGESFLPSDSMQAVSSPKINRAFPLHMVLSIFLVLWITVAVLKLVCEFIAYRTSMKNLNRMSIPAYNTVTLRSYSSVCRLKGVRNPPELMQNATLSTPLLTGILKPQLYLPAVGYSAEELKLIFHHELSHYCHKDLWYKMLLRLCATVYWFNPFLLIMLKEADNDIENLCDTRVIRHCTTNDHKLYRRLLLRTVAIQNHIPYVTASLNDSTMVFKDRILYMINLKHLKKSILPGIMLTFLLIAVNASVAFSASEREPAAPARQIQSPDNIPAESDPVPTVVPAEEAQSEPVPMIKNENPLPADTSAEEQAETALSENNSTSAISYNADVSNDASYGSTDSSSQSGESYTPDNSQGSTQGPAPSSGVPYTGGFDMESGYVNSVTNDNGDINALKDNGNGTYSDDNGTNYIYNGGNSWSSENGDSYSTFDDKYHYFGMELESHTLSGNDGSSTEIIQTTNGDYYYRDENGTGFTHNDDGTWTDEYGNSYTE